MSKSARKKMVSSQEEVAVGTQCGEPSLLIYFLQLKRSFRLLLSQQRPN